MTVIDAQEKGIGEVACGDGVCAAIGDEGNREVAEDKDGDANADGGGCEGCETTDEKDGEWKLPIHPRSGENAEWGDGAAADDIGGEGAMVGCTTAVEDDTEV